MALVSVFIPTKNRQALLHEAIASVLQQSYHDLEVIVVNDGSTDGTHDYLQALCARDARVKVIHNANSIGACASRNRAILASSGEFVTGLDDDDEFQMHRVQGLLDYWALLEASGEEFSCLYTQDLIRRGGHEQRSQKMSSATFEQLCRRNVIGNQIFARRALLVELGGFDEQLTAWEDLDLYMRIVKRAGPARLLDAATYLFDDEPRPDRRSRRVRDRIVQGCRQVLAKNPAESARLKQELLLQVYSDFYGIYPYPAEVTLFFRYGIHPRNLLFLLKALDPRRLHSH